MQRNKDKYSFIKFLSVINIIIKNSDEKNPMTVNDIKDKLYESDYDFHIDYRLIKKYVKYYNEYYEDTIIECYKKGRNDNYYFVNTTLDTMEAKAIVDLIYSSDFFTLKTKENYKKRIQDMFSIHYHAYFDKLLNLHIEKNENDQVFYKELEVVVNAIKNHKKIRFEYHKPFLTKKENNKKIELAPIDTYFANNEYYLLCQGAIDPQLCITYRLDYVKNVEIINDSSFFFSELEIQSFHEKLKNITYMYGEGKMEIIELEFHESVYSNIIDKFGKNIKPKKFSNDTYKIQVKNVINSTFYSWIIGFGGKIQISGNAKQVDKFKKFLNEKFL